MESVEIVGSGDKNNRASAGIEAGARWLGFGCASKLTHTTVHFFPSSGSVTAPYPASVKLSIFSPEFGEKRVTLEGARLSQPDGVRLADAFSILSEPRANDQKTTWFGLSIEASTLESKVDLTASQCLIEFSGKGRSAKFSPKRIKNSMISDKQNEVSAWVQAEPAVIFRDQLINSTIVIVNASSESLATPLSFISESITRAIEGGRTQQEVKLLPVALAPIGPLSTYEVGVEDSVTANTTNSSLIHPQITGSTGAREPTTSSVSFGNIKQQTVLSHLSERSDCAAYVVYREILNRRIIAVQAL